MLRPSPVPASVRVRPPSSWRNRSNTTSRCSSGMPGPLSAISITARAVSGSTLTSQRTTPYSGVTLKALDSRFTTTRCRWSGSSWAKRRLAGADAERHAAVGRAGLEEGCGLPDVLGEIELGVVEGDAARLELRCVEQVVHVAQQHAALRATTSRSLRSRVAGRRGIEQLLDRGQDQRQRRAQLVADVGKELALQVIELLGPFVQLGQFGVGVLELRLASATSRPGRIPHAAGPRRCAAGGHSR